jgi:biotin carboxylase
MCILIIGYNDNLLAGLDETLPAGSVVLLEEPELWAGRRLAAKAAAHPCLGDVRFGLYQRHEQYRDVIRDLTAIQAVAPGTEYSVVPAADTAQSLGLPGAGLPAAMVLRDKLMLREVTASAGLRSPGFREIHSAADVAGFARGRACVVKPAQRQASLGVILLEPGHDPAAAWRECIEADEVAQVANRPMSWRYMVEERLDGPEFSTECLVRDSEALFLNVTRKRTVPGRHPVESGHLVPGCPAEESDRWRQAVKGLIRAVKFDTGILHAEWILVGEDPVLVECAGRPPGDRIMDLIDLAYGVNLNHQWVRLLAGAEVEMPAQAPRGAAIRFLIPGAGTIDRITGTEEARAACGVHRVDLRLKPGDTVAQVASSWDRVGSVIAVEETADQAEQRAASAAAAITVWMTQESTSGEVND